MTPEENATPEAEVEAQGGTAAGAGEEGAAAKPLNRSERRAQAQGKKGQSETGLLANLRQNQVHGLKGKQAGGGSKNRFQRKV